MKNLSAIIGWLLLLIAFAIYVTGICYAIFDPIVINEPGKQAVHKLPEALETATATIGAILLTNLGAVLGISVSKPQSALANMTFITAKIDVPEPATLREMVQFSAVLIYIITLVACGIKWGIASFKADPDPLVTLIPLYGKTLLGVITAYLAFILAAR